MPRVCPWAFQQIPYTNGDGDDSKMQRAPYGTGWGVRVELPESAVRPSCMSVPQGMMCAKGFASKYTSKVYSPST